MIALESSLRRSSITTTIDKVKNDDEQYVVRSSSSSSTQQLLFLNLLSRDFDSYCKHTSTILNFTFSCVVDITTLHCSYF